MKIALGFIIGLLVGIAIGWGGATFLPIQELASPPPEQAVVPTPPPSPEMAACIASHNQIKERVLVSPATAVFQDCAEATFQYTPAYPNDIVVLSEVDSENAAGGFVRTRYFARMTPTESGWTLVFFDERE